VRVHRGRPPEPAKRAPALPPVAVWQGCCSRGSSRRAREITRRAANAHRDDASRRFATGTQARTSACMPRSMIWSGCGRWLFPARAADDAGAWRSFEEHLPLRCSLGHDASLRRVALRLAAVAAGGEPNHDRTTCEEPRLEARWGFTVGRRRRGLAMAGRGEC
jgi:hypothetical protein